MNINDRLNELLGANQAKRLAEEKALDERRDNPKILRHTTYQGDRKIQQLGDEIIENGVVLNNQSIKIGDPVVPLAKGNVLRRVDNTNGGALLGSAYRKAVENDHDANGSRRNNDLGRNGGDEPRDDSSNPNDPRNNPNDPPRFPPPFGCTPPPPQCIWTSDPNVPNGYQSHGSAVINENGVELFLYCTAGTAMPPDLGCDFLKPADKWQCSNGVCIASPTGTFNTEAECNAARPIRWRGYLTTFYNGVAPGFCTTPASTNLLVAEGIISQAQSPVTAVVDNTTSPTPGCPGKNHYAFIDALGNRLAFIAGSADSAYVTENFTCS
jgi:hypothetical protein